MSNKSNLNYVFVAQTSDGEIKIQFLKYLSNFQFCVLSRLFLNSLTGLLDITGLWLSTTETKNSGVLFNLYFLSNIGVDDRSFRATFTKKRRHYASELPKKLKTLCFPLNVTVDTAFRAIRKSRRCHASYQLPELINVVFRTTWKRCCSSYQLSEFTTYNFLFLNFCPLFLP